MTFLVLANPDDETAVRVAVLLRQRHGAARVQLCTADELVLAHWEHRVACDGVESSIRLHDGAVLCDSKGTVIFNRLDFIDPPMFEGAATATRDYARMELFALVLSWLSSPQFRVINRASPSGMGGAAYRPLVWQHLALRAGFRGLALTATTSTRRFPPDKGAVLRPDIGCVSDPYALPLGNGFSWYSQTVPDRRVSVLVAGEQVIGNIPEPSAQSCRRLARLAGIDLLQIDLGYATDSPADLVFTGANVFPVVSEPGALLSVVEFLEMEASIGAAAVS